jgi:seryl-tRNA synthetase
MLNGTAVTARALLAVMENFQADGVVAVPEVLQRYGAPAHIDDGPAASAS